MHRDHDWLAACLGIIPEGFEEHWLPNITADDVASSQHSDQKRILGLEREVGPSSGSGGAH